VEIDKGYQTGLLGKVKGVRLAGMSRVCAYLETCKQEDVTQPERPSQTLVSW
jgi:DNA-binding Xre family transcriptional regulator